jgi:hypothetical protein
VEPVPHAAVAIRHALLCRQRVAAPRPVLSDLLADLAQAARAPR